MGIDLLRWWMVRKAEVRFYNTAQPVLREVSFFALRYSILDLFNVLIYTAIINSSHI